jgi:hypothetical protein
VEVFLFTIWVLGSGPALASEPKPWDCPEVFYEFSATPRQTLLEGERTLDFSSIEPTLQELLTLGPWQGPGESHRALLRASLENSIQHGVEDFYFPEPARVGLSFIRGPHFDEIRIRNSLHKPFPQRLLGEFRPGQEVELRVEERPMPRGMGMGLRQTFREFAKLPATSLMGWRLLPNQRVEFFLKLPRAPNL